MKEQTRLAGLLKRLIDLKEARKVSALADIASIGPSMLEDSNLDHNVTAVHIPQPEPEPQKRHEPQTSYHNSYGEHDLRGNYGTQATMERWLLPYGSTTSSPYASQSIVTLHRT